MNLSIKLRLFALAAVSVLALIIVGTIGVYSLKNVGGKVKEIDKVLVPIKKWAEVGFQAAGKKLNAVSSKLVDEQVKQIMQFVRYC